MPIGFSGSRSPARASLIEETSAEIAAFWRADGPRFLVSSRAGGEGINLQVARRILASESALRPRFVWVPLDIASDHGITALAAMITMTPGTLSAEISADRRALLVHALDVDDEAALVAEIKQRYEQPLMQILPAGEEEE